MFAVFSRILVGFMRHFSLKLAIVACAWLQYTSLFLHRCGNIKPPVSVYPAALLGGIAWGAWVTDTLHFCFK